MAARRRVSVGASVWNEDEDEDFSDLDEDTVGGADSDSDDNGSVEADSDWIEQSPYVDDEQQESESENIEQDSRPPSKRKPSKPIRAARKRHCVASQDRPDMVLEGDNSSRVHSVDHIPRQRHSETWNERVELIKGARPVANLVPSFPLEVANDWNTFIKAMDAYIKKHNLRMRRRDSTLTATYNKNRDPSDRLPTRFTWTKMTYRCTHGCFQKPRGTGQRTRKPRFKGCPARISAKVVLVKGDWKIITFNETRTHSHATSKAVADTYAGAGSIDNDLDLHEKVADMVDLRAEPKLVTAYLAKHLKRNVTPQQARNIIRRIQGQGAPQARLKEMLHKLVQGLDNDVLLIQDQNSVTIGIVLQTAVQKQCFRKWGECLVMDWTHATNNLRYHLGSLLITSPAGRGIPVVDFVAIDEKATTMDAILAFFKEKNPEWTRVETFVIDKDFVEWRALNKSFPNAKVLLCQYHAITYWRKLLGGRSYNLKVAQKEMLETMFIRMLKSYTATSFSEYYEQFADYCRQESPKVLEYFNKNWKSCSEMWADYARGAYFTAGNTTTNRIEANWNQLKRLTGVRPTMDKTVSSLLQHQVAVIQDFSSTVTRLSITSREPSTVIPFLRRISARLSDAAYLRVRREWDMMCTDMSDAQIFKVPNSTNWEVFTNYHGYICNDIDWQCSCHFSTSVRLPCRHLMLVARDGHGFKELPDLAVHKRWCMHHASNLLEELDRGLATVSIALGCEGRKGDVEMTAFDTAPLGDSAPLTDPASSAKSVGLVRLRRREQANMVVMSDAEKYQYAKAAIDPLLDRLANLSTVKFYKALAAWSELLATHLNAVDNYCDDVEDAGEQTQAKSDEDCDDKVDKSEELFSKRNIDNQISEFEETVENSGEINGIIDSSDILGDFEAMVAIEDDSTARYLTYTRASQIPLPLLDISSQSQEIINGNCNSTNKSGGGETAEDQPRSMNDLMLKAPVEVPERIQSDASNASDNIAGDDISKKCQEEPKADAPARNVDMLVLAPPIPRTRSRKKLKQGHIHATPVRRAAITWPDSPVSLSDVIQWAKNVSNVMLIKDVFEVYPLVMTDRFLEGRQPVARREWVRSTDYDYNFIIPRQLVKSLEAVISTEKNHEEKADRLRRRNGILEREVEDVDTEEERMKQQGRTRQLVLSFGKSIKEFNSAAVYSMDNFYRLKAKSNAWAEDMRWLRRSWDLCTENLDMMLELFAEGNFTSEKRVDRDKRCVQAILERYETSSFATTFKLLSETWSISFYEVVGYVARDCMLSDSILQIAIQSICDLHRGCKLLNPLFTVIGWPSTPRTPCGEAINLMKMRYLILPINISNIHWALAVVRIFQGTITAFFYDPLNKFKADVEIEWEQGMLPYIRKWFDDYALENPDAPQRFPQVHLTWIKGPKQPDQSSCGVLVIAQVYALVNNSSSFQPSSVITAEYVRRLRLRILWLLLCETHKESPPPQRWEACQKIHDHLGKHFEKDKTKAWQMAR